MAGAAVDKFLKNTRGTLWLTCGSPRFINGARHFLIILMSDANRVIDVTIPLTHYEASDNQVLLSTENTDYLLSLLPASRTKLRQPDQKKP